jgi:hypothetical protein
MIGRTLDLSPGPHSYWNKLWRLAGRVAAPAAAAAPAVHAVLYLRTSVSPSSVSSLGPLSDPPGLAFDSDDWWRDGDGFRDLWATAIDPRCRLSTCRESTPRRAHAHAHADANLPPRDYPSTSTTSLVIFRSSKDGSGRMAEK